MRTILMRAMSQRRDNTDGKTTPAERGRALDAAALDQVASAGGRTCTSSNPVQD